MIDSTKDFCFHLIGNAVIFFKRHLFSPGPSGKSTNHRLNPTLSCIDPLALGRRLKANVYHIFHGPEPENPKKFKYLRACNRHNPCANRTSHPITLWVSRACPESKSSPSLPVLLFFLLSSSKNKNQFTPRVLRWQIRVGGCAAHPKLQKPCKPWRQETHPKVQLFPSGITLTAVTSKECPKVGVTSFMWPSLTSQWYLLAEFFILGDALAAQWEGRTVGHEQGLLLLYLCPVPSSQNKKTHQVKYRFQWRQNTLC